MPDCRTIMPMTWRSAPPRQASSSRASRSRAARDRYTAKDGPDGWWPTPEPPHRINQIYLEPVLVEFAAAMPGLRYLNRIKVLGFTQTEDAVTAEAQDLDNGETLLITADYLIGCDGAVVGDPPSDRRAADGRRR